MHTLKLRVERDYAMEKYEVNHGHFTACFFT